jgi:hypothetical protein
MLPLLPTLAAAQQHTEAKSMDWSMDWSTVFAGLLVLVTGELVWVAWRQLQDARVLQRAYVGALPGGISTTTRGELLAH